MGGPQTCVVRFDGQIAALQRHGGIARYILELSQGLAARPGFAVQLDRRWCLPQWSGLDLAGPVHVAPPRLPGALRLLAACAAAWSDPPLRAGEISHPTYYLPSHRRQRGAARVVTMYDCIPERVPGQAGGRLPSWVRRQAARSADLCLCISQRTADDVHELFGVPRERLAVTPLGLVPLPAPRLDHPHARPFILFVGLRAGYKGWSVLRRAYESEPRLHDACDLVCAGGPPLHDAEQPAAGRAVRVDADDQRLADLYAHALAFAYPSLYEGFGLPVLEAMASGCPVVTTTGGSLPEVAGDAARLVAPGDPDALAAGLLAALGEGRSGLALRGPARAAAFTWDRTIDLTIAAYCRALEFAA